MTWDQAKSSPCGGPSGCACADSLMALLLVERLACRTPLTPARVSPFQSANASTHRRNCAHTGASPGVAPPGANDGGCQASPGVQPLGLLSRQHVPHHLAMHVRQPIVAPLETER